MTNLDRLALAWLTSKQAENCDERPSVTLLHQVGGDGADLIVGAAEKLRDVASALNPPPVVRTYALRSANPRNATHDLDTSPFLMVVHVDVDESDRPEVRRWLDEEHSPRQLAVPGAEWYRGYEEIGAPNTFINIWGLADPSVLSSAEWAAARNTQWRARLDSSMRHLARGVFVRPDRANATSAS